MARARSFYFRAKVVYHKYGLKHVCLILLLVVYQFIGAAIFLHLEGRAEETKEFEWENKVKENRSRYSNFSEERKKERKKERTKERKKERKKETRKETGEETGEERKK